MPTTKADSYALFKNEEGWKASQRPAPYDTWQHNTVFGPEYCSSYNTTGHPSKLNAFCVKALLSLMDRKNSEIGICKVTAGSYASQWNQPDGTTILATAQSGGDLRAAIRNSLGVHSRLPGLGNSNTHFDPTSILALYILIEADRSKQNGNTQSITWELLDTCRKEWESTGVMNMKAVYMVNDALYYGLTYKDGIPCSLAQGNISLLTSRRIASGEYASTEVLFGRPDLFVPQADGPQAIQEMTIAAARAEFAEYIASRSWTEEEKAMIPVYPDNMPVPPEVMTFARRFVKSRSFKNPLNNFCWRGGTGFGKSTGAEILACILRTPFVRITCSEQTELNDFLSQFVPNPDADASILAASLPSFQDISMDPVGAYEVLTGKIDEDVDPDEVMKIRDEMLVARSNASHFKLVVSPFVTALEKGWIVEPSEFGRIRSAGTLVGLNNYDKPGSRSNLKAFV